MNNFDGQSVLVVGGSSGIGAATAKAFAQAGANVTIASRNPQKLAEAARHISADIVTAVLDTTDDDAVNAFFAQSTPFDHIVVSAAETPSGPVRMLPVADARVALESKFWGAYHIARAAKINANGSLTLVSGFLSVRPSKTSVLQGAINAALEALARGLALEFSPIRVNTVSPGLVDTPLWNKLDDAARGSMFASAAEHLPARRIGKPEDVARAILYLAANPYASGSTILVDGGGAIA